MEDIRIPSPSAILAPSPPAAAPALAPAAAARRSDSRLPRPTTSAAPAGEPARDRPAAAQAKPKQSKSRNGRIDFPGVLALRLMGPTEAPLYRATVLTMARLSHLQGQAPEMRRVQAHLPAVQEAQRAVRRVQEGIQVAALRRVQSLRQVCLQGEKGYVGLRPIHVCPRSVSRSGVSLRTTQSLRRRRDQSRIRLRASLRRPRRNVQPPPWKHAPSR